MPTPALVPRSTCNPTSQIERWHSCTSCWPGQAPQPVLRDHRPAPMTATQDAGAAAPRLHRPQTKRFAARTKASTTPCAAPWGAPPAAALVPDARRSALSQVKAACLFERISTDQPPRPKTPALMTKAGTAAAPQKAAAAGAGIRPSAAGLPPRQGVHEEAADEMRRRPQHQSHGSLQSPRWTPL